MAAPRKFRPSLPLRLALVAAISLAAGGLLLTVLIATDTALSIWERLRDAPVLLKGFVASAFALLLGFTAWLAFRLLRPAPAIPPPPRPLVTREAVDQRLSRIAQRTDVVRARGELEELDRRAGQQEVYVALFGDISTGKTTLMRALTGNGELAIDVRAGTTREVAHAQGFLPDGRSLVLADAPGLNEAGGEARAELARAEALRAHVLVFVVDGDISRTQHAELEAVLAFDKPAVIALNKLDRYRAEELAAISGRLRKHYGGRALVVPVSAGGEREITKILPDGLEQRGTRPRAPQLAALLEALSQLSAPGAQGLEPSRRRGVLETVSLALEREEAALREQDADAIVKRYTRRAVVGALAAVAPGTDLLIQGALGTAMLRELAQLYGVALRELDIDGFIERAAGTVRTHASITLMIAGNALKAFPGLGTIGGGLVHALAYGMIFDALGRAVAGTLATRAVFDPDVALETAAALLEKPEENRLAVLARLTSEVWRERGANPGNDRDA